jgi:hypothetical protein
MRTIRYRLRKEVKTLLSEIATQFKLEKSFVLDLYAFLKLRGNGIPSDDRVKKMAKYVASQSQGKASELTVSILLKKRVQQLKTIGKNAVFKGLALRKNAVDALRELIQALQDFGRKARQAQCITCQFVKQCEFGKQYKDSTRDITKVFDPDYEKKVHDQCPVRPEIDRSNQLAASALAFNNFFSSMNAANAQAAVNSNPESYAPGGTDPTSVKAALDAQEAAELSEPPDTDTDTDPASLNTEVDDTPVLAKMFSSWEASEGKHDTSFTGNNLILSQNLMQQISTSSLALFEIGRKFSLALTAQKKGKFKPVSHVADSQKSAKMQNLGDLTKLESSQHGLPEEVFEQRLAKKSLSKREEQKHNDKKQLLYLLVDDSGSMSGWFESRSTISMQRHLFTRSGLSMTLSIALTRRVEEDKGIMFVRMFAGAPGPLMTARDRDTFEKLRWNLANCNYNGGGTNILAAIRQAREDILNADKTDELAKAEILLISDNEDAFNEDRLREAVKGVEFNVLDVSGSEFKDQGSSGALKRLATHYYKANEGALDVNKLVELI